MKKKELRNQKKIRKEFRHVTEIIIQSHDILVVSSVAIGSALSCWADEPSHSWAGAESGYLSLSKYSSRSRHERLWAAQVGFFVPKWILYLFFGYFTVSKAPPCAPPTSEVPTGRDKAIPWCYRVSLATVMFLLTMVHDACHTISMHPQPPQCAQMAVHGCFFF